jgi:hypothetical protein
MWYLEVLLTSQSACCSLLVHICFSPKPDWVLFCEESVWNVCLMLGLVVHWPGLLPLLY